MKRQNKITILSTFARDRLLDEGGNLIKEQEGGPAFYLKNTFENEKFPFILKPYPSIVKVEILMKKTGELGKVPKKPRPLKIKFSSIKTPFLLISTLLDEFNLKGISNFKGKTFLDIQGYVRDGRDFGKKKYWKPDKEIVKSIFCLKGTRQELEYIPKSFLNLQKQKILIITKGRSGCELFSFGKRYFIKPTKVVKVTDTIGAGDVFFASFIINFLKTENPFNSTKFAVKNATKFLLSKIYVNR